MKGKNFSIFYKLCSLNIKTSCKAYLYSVSAGGIEESRLYVMLLIDTGFCQESGHRTASAKTLHRIHKK